MSYKRALLSLELKLKCLHHCFISSVECLFMTTPKDLRSWPSGYLCCSFQLILVTSHQDAMRCYFKVFFVDIYSSNSINKNALFLNLNKSIEVVRSQHKVAKCRVLHGIGVATHLKLVYFCLFVRSKEV